MRFFLFCFPLGFFLGLGWMARAQVAPDSLLSLADLKQQKVFTSLAEARQNPEAVLVLDLGGQKLGSLPPEIAQMTNLQKLVLYGNALRQIPPFLGQLRKLRYLDLYDNALDALPTEFGLLQNLVYLDLGDNRLREFPEVLGQLPDLQHLYLYGNRLKALPEALGQLSGLRTLRLGGGFRFLGGGNRLRQLPEGLGQLQDLEELYLPDNLLKKLPLTFTNLDALRWLDLGHNRFRHIPLEIKELSDNLRYVRLWDRNFDAAEKESFEREMLNTRFVFEQAYEGRFSGLSAALSQGRFTTLELGLARAFVKDFLMMAIGFSGEYQIQKQAGGIKASFWVNGLTIFSLGMHGGYYWESLKNAAFLRPEFGLGHRTWQLAYGYNVLFNRNIENLNRHLLTLRVVVPVFPGF
ncbi:MAG: leucine-rich repeat domain-containing protein [Microscillaceae bacterium]|nr:leucine-rich repeat domain-containing protein [Microscillaceae bacterium]